MGIDVQVALALEGLYKRFGGPWVVDGVELVVPAGSFFGLLGPNGAGKTTTLSMAVGLLWPDQGVARIFGVDVWTDPVRAKTVVGVLPDGLALPERLTGREVLYYTGLLRGIPKVTVVERTDELLSVLELTDAESTVVVDYSAGMRKKIGLAAALLHAPILPGALGRAQLYPWALSVLPVFLGVGVAAAILLSVYTAYPLPQQHQLPEPPAPAPPPGTARSRLSTA
jgi:ABC-2 type transport system ATP-binding protein